MVVLAPAHDIGPCYRDILAAADLEWPGKARVWNRPGIWTVRTHIMENMRAARTVRGKRNQRQHGGDPTTRGGGVSPEATRVSERFPCQPASSSDRVRQCRGQMSKHRYIGDLIRVARDNCARPVRRDPN